MLVGVTARSVRSIIDEQVAEPGAQNP